MSDTAQVPGKVSKEYIPPDEMTIREYARSVCQALSHQYPAIGKREVVSGLTEFLLYLAPLTAKYLNTQHREKLLKDYVHPSVKHTNMEESYVSK
jgi:hypothetical protein